MSNKKISNEYYLYQAEISIVLIPFFTPEELQDLCGHLAAERRPVVGRRAARLDQVPVGQRPEVRVPVVVGEEPDLKLTNCKKMKI